MKLLHTFGINFESNTGTTWFYLGVKNKKDIYFLEGDYRKLRELKDNFLEDHPNIEITLYENYLMIEGDILVSLFDATEVKSRHGLKPIDISDAKRYLLLGMMGNDSSFENEKSDNIPTKRLILTWRKGTLAIKPEKDEDYEYESDQEEDDKNDEDYEDYENYIEEKPLRSPIQRFLAKKDIDRSYTFTKLVFDEKAGGVVWLPSRNYANQEILSAYCPRGKEQARRLKTKILFDKRESQARPIENLLAICDSFIIASKDFLTGIYGNSNEITCIDLCDEFYKERSKAVNSILYRWKQNEHKLASLTRVEASSDSNLIGKRKREDAPMTLFGGLKLVSLSTTSTTIIEAPSSLLPELPPTKKQDTKIPGRSLYESIVKNPMGLVSYFHYRNRFFPDGNSKTIQENPPFQIQHKMTVEEKIKINAKFLNYSACSPLRSPLDSSPVPRSTCTYPLHSNSSDSIDLDAIIQRERILKK